MQVNCSQDMGSKNSMAEGIIKHKRNIINSLRHYQIHLVAEMFVEDPRAGSKSFNPRGQALGRFFACVCKGVRKRVF